MALIELTVYSQALQMEVDLYAVLPETTKGLIGMDGKAAEHCPTLYLLHGMSDDHSIWQRRTSIERYAAEKGLAVIMPAADLSYYSDMHMGENYWQFVARELPGICRSLFPMLSPDREDTFVAGLSMGGYGALKCALRASDTFSCGAGLSAVADIVDTVTKLTKRRIGQAAYWQDVFGDPAALPGSFNDLFTAASDYAKNEISKPIRLYMWCGTEDGLYDENVRLRNLLQALSLDLTYEESSGNHAWVYWDKKIQDVINWLPIRKEAQ